MEIIIILIVIGIIGYFIYQSLPSTKFDKAKALQETGNHIEAITIFESIIEKHPDAPANIAKSKFEQGLTQVSNNTEVAISFFNQVIDIRKKLTQKSNKSLYESFESKAYFEICNIKFNQIIKNKQLENILNSVNENLKYLENSRKTGLESEFSELKNKHLLKLSEIYYAIGINNEKSQKTIDAIQNYTKAIEFANKTSNSIIKVNSNARIGICKLKNNEYVDNSFFVEINKSPIEIKNDFYFRHTKSLLNKKEYATAEEIISNYLSFKSTKIDNLKSIILANKQRDSLVQISEINETLDKLYEKSFPISDVKILYDKLDGIYSSTKSIIPDISEKVIQLKPSLFNRLLTHYISKEEFANAINLILKYPLFWENYELLKNLGICCFGFLSQGRMTEKNYKTIISSWLTAVFSDKVIIKSIENTTWDNEYTFTLSDSIGSNYSIYDELPENVNNDEVSDSNISIGSTQRELLNQFESLLRQEVNDSNLINTVLNFYSSERDAIEKIVSIIDKDRLFASPHFAKTYNINETIIADLDEDYEEYSNEDALDAGICYLKSNSETFVREYSIAKESVDKAIEAIEEEDLSELELLNNSNNKSLIEKYESVNSIVEDKLFNAISLKINEDDENEDLISIMEEAILFSNRNEKLKYQCSNYVANFCIKKVNDNEMNNFHALSLMKNAYFHSSNNPRVCNNIITLIRFNIMDILNDNTNKGNDIYRILDEIYPRRSELFIQSSSELSDTKTELINGLNQAGIDFSVFNHQHLNAEGEKLKKGIMYFKKMSEG